ncbi:Bro-N domain-containing protein [Pokkaliibacter sp. MBI-7]|uniref:BRO-N domain-containing protein n=1 Tax=Pokkaliibacter sp. MBI-7 TaxID=3040600 RepID=UPI00244B6CC6|nr:Bro-N domain-containing protein [Pokkaliibacter sp. MBI-7]MDH2435634.1 Bro-N domain-containing protein [Pokkaliibacter sp. MBI-7]
MSKHLTSFSFDSHDIRSTLLNDQPWFVAVDVCSALDLANPRQVISRLDEDEKGVLNVDTLGGSQEVACINESGLYSLILTSRKPEAKRFKKWVTAEVLPTIRKTGRYEGTPARTLVPVTPVTAFPPASELVRKIHGYFAITSLSLAALLNLDHNTLCAVIDRVPCSDAFRRTQISTLTDYINGTATTFRSLSRDAALLVIDQCSGPALYTVREAVAKAFDKIAVPFPPDVPGNRRHTGSTPPGTVTVPVLSPQQAVAVAEPLIAPPVSEAIHAAAVVLAKRHEPLYRHRLLHEAQKGTLPRRQFDELPEVMERLWLEQQREQVAGIPVSDLLACHELITEWLTFARFAQRCTPYERTLAEASLTKWEQKAHTFGDDYLRRHGG